MRCANPAWIPPDWTPTFSFWKALSLLVIPVLVLLLLVLLFLLSALAPEVAAGLTFLADATNFGENEKNIADVCCMLSSRA